MDQPQVNTAEDQDTSARSQGSEQGLFGFGILLIVLIALAMHRIFLNDFTWFDDHMNLHQNPMLNPVGVDTFRHYWTTPEFGLFVPITQTFWALIASVAMVDYPDAEGIRLNPMLFHGGSLLVHCVTSLFVMKLLYMLIPSRVAALLGAAFFAIHPLQVETVAWAAMFKDLLAWMFCSIACVLYAWRTKAANCAMQSVDGGAANESFTKNRFDWAGQVGLTALFMLAFFSKPQAMVLPAAIFAIGVFGLSVQWKDVLFRTCMLWILVPLMMVFAKHVQDPAVVYSPPLWARPMIAGDAVFFYLSKLFWPVDLVVDYTRYPERVMKEWWFWLTWLVPAVLLFASWRIRRRFPYLLLGVVLFALGPAPMLGFSRFLFQYYSTVSDHYVYFGLLGPAFIVAWLCSTRPKIVVPVMVLILIALGLRTHDQSRHWQNSRTLFEHAMKTSPNSLLALNNLGVARFMEGRFTESMDLLNRATKVRNDTNATITSFNVVLTYFAMGDFAAGEKAMDELLTLLDAPNFGDEIQRIQYRLRLSGNLLNARQYGLAKKYIDQLHQIVPDAAQVLRLQADLDKATGTPRDK